MKKLLIVEDDDDIAKGLANWFRIHGYIVILANNGKQGVIEVQKQKPDLILMDIEMPLVNGIDACKQLKTNKATYNIPIIMVTSKSDTVDYKKSFAVGANDFIIKPFNMERLNEKIQKLLGSE